MRVGLVIYGSLETVSGGYLYDRKLVEHLRQAGDTVEIISLPWRSYPAHLLDNLSASLAWRLSELPIDLLLQDELNHTSLLSANRRLGRRRPYPIVSIVHHLRSSEAHPAWQKRIYRRVEASYLRGVQAFVFNSRTTRQAVQAALGPRFPLPPHVVAFPAGDRFQAAGLADLSAAEISARARQPGPLRLLFLGSLIPRKGLQTLLQAISFLPETQVSLEIAGSESADPAYARRMRLRAAEPDLRSRVSFHRALADEPLAALLRRSQVLALPSSYEGYGIAYLEGMGFGLAAIAGQDGAAGEIITHGQDGFLVPAGDANRLAEVIALLAADRERLEALSLAARQRFLAHPTWEDSTARIRSFLHSLLPPA